ncbi:MAG: D-aminoacyl-tRNA deacylase [Candidatus Pacearchaeota archaeon]|jgi:D-aminoacyl-tRNA deacylase
MFKKYLIIASKQDLAGMNILTQFFQYIDEFQNKNVKFETVDGSILDEGNLDLEKINNFDFVVFASKHSTSSTEKQKTISIHAPGNFREVWGGGKQGKLGISSALFNKHLFENLEQQIQDLDLRGYKLTLEVTHHGPLINKPCLFLEIGSTEIDWKDKRAGFVIANALKKAIDTFEENKYREIAVAIGGPHYCPSFNKIQSNSNVAISHIIPGYVSPITEEFIEEAIEKTLEEIDFVILDWKGLGNSEQRDKVVEILNKNYIQWKRASEIN